MNLRHTILILVLACLLLPGRAFSQQSEHLIHHYQAIGLPFTTATLRVDLSLNTFEEYSVNVQWVELSLTLSGDNKTTLPSDPDDLNDDWEEQTEQAPNRRTFKHKTKEIVIQFDEGQEGKDGWEGKDHWYVRKPNWKESDNKKYFDVHKDGNPLNKGSDKSHIDPGTEVILPVKTTTTCGDSETEPLEEELAIEYFRRKIRQFS